MVASIGGGLVGTIYAMIKPGKFVAVMDLVNPILGSLVGITAGCAVFHTFEAFVVGIIGGAIVLAVSGIPDYFGVDDPVGAAVVHGRYPFCFSLNS
jgi:Amt family ammonium transporter